MERCLAIIAWALMIFNSIAIFITITDKRPLTPTVFIMMLFLYIANFLMFGILGVIISEGKGKNKNNKNKIHFNK